MRGRFHQVPLNQVIKSQNKIIYTVVDVLNIYSLKIIKIFKINQIRRAIKTILLLRLLHQYHWLSCDKCMCDWVPRRKSTCNELSSARIWQHNLCATLFANVNINYRLPIKIYYRICTVRHIRIEIFHGSQNMFWVLAWVRGY